MAYDEHLAHRIRSLLGTNSGVREKKMFGGLCFLSEGGHMLVGVVGDRLMARVGPDQHASALERPHARPMDFTGRPLKGMVYVDPEGVETDSALAGWLAMADEFVSGLPPK